MIVKLYILCTVQDSVTLGECKLCAEKVDKKGLKNMKSGVFYFHSEHPSVEL